MNKINNWFNRVIERIRNMFRRIKNVYNEDRRKFWEIALKFSFGILFFVSLFIPIYRVELNGVTNDVNIFDNNAWFIYLVIYLSLPIIYLNNALGFKNKTADSTYRILSILSIIMSAYLILSFFTSKSDYPIMNFSLSPGFYINIAITVIVFLLAYYDKPFLKTFYKIFKISDIIEVKYVN